MPRSRAVVPWSSRPSLRWLRAAVFTRASPAPLEATATADKVPPNCDPAKSRPQPRPGAPLIPDPRFLAVHIVSRLFPNPAASGASRRLPTDRFAASPEPKGRKGAVGTAPSFLLTAALRNPVTGVAHGAQPASADRRENRFCWSVRHRQAKSVGSAAPTRIDLGNCDGPPAPFAPFRVTFPTQKRARGESPGPWRAVNVQQISVRWVSVQRLSEQQLSAQQLSEQQLRWRPLKLAASGHRTSGHRTSGQRARRGRVSGKLCPLGFGRSSSSGSLGPHPSW